MPEGPSIVILKEEVQQFKGRKVIAVRGNSRIDKDRLLNRKIVSFKSWGKHFLICFSHFTVRIHFLMWGSYSINEKKNRKERLCLTFRNGEINFYSTSVKLIEGDLKQVYDFSSDVLSDTWDEEKALIKLSKLSGIQVCDVLLDQDIFSGVGNIIKNEVLYRIGVHPESVIGNIPENLIKAMVKEARNYSFEFLEWKKRFELKKNWLVHRKEVCCKCGNKLMRKQTGTKNRRSFFCTNCQILY